MPALASGTGCRNFSRDHRLLHTAAPRQACPHSSWPIAHAPAGARAPLTHQAPSTSAMSQSPDLPPPRGWRVALECIAGVWLWRSDQGAVVADARRSAPRSRVLHSRVRVVFADCWRKHSGVRVDWSRRSLSLSFCEAATGPLQRYHCRRWPKGTRSVWKATHDRQWTPQRRRVPRPSNPQSPRDASRSRAAGRRCPSNGTITTSLAGLTRKAAAASAGIVASWAGSEPGRPSSSA